MGRVSIVVAWKPFDPIDPTSGRGVLLREGLKVQVKPLALCDSGGSQDQLDEWISHDVGGVHCLPGKSGSLARRALEEVELGANFGGRGPDVFRTVGHLAKKIGSAISKTIGTK